MKRLFKYTYILIIGIILIIAPLKVCASSITLDKSRLTIGIGYSENLTYTLGTGLNSNDIIWTSSNENVVMVNSGKITTLKTGTSIITASINGIKSTCRVDVILDYLPVTKVTLNKSKITLLVGNKETLLPTITPSNATNKDITWKSSDSSVATVNFNGLITAKSPGKATIIAMINDKIKEHCEVTVTHSLSLNSISLNKTTITIKERTTEQLTVKYNPSNATNKKVTWKSSNTNVVTVNSSGLVTAKNPGTATITVVSNDGGYVAECRVTVEEISKKVTGISLNKTELSILAGKTEELKVTVIPDYAENKNVTWKSSNDKIATVDNGKITALYPGEVEIKAISEDGDKEAICKVTVISPPVEEISFEEEQKTVYIDSKNILKIVTKPSNSILDNAIWTSSDENVVTVENGIVKALSIGEATITVSNQEKTLSTSIQITVIEHPKEPLEITIEGYELNFNPANTKYNLSIKDEDNLIINTNENPENVIIKGNQNLKNGSIITITITDDESITYIINIKKKQNYTIYFLAIISVLLLFNLLRIMLKNKKKPKL